LLSTYHEQIRHLAARFHVNILVGASAREDDRRYNAAYLYHDDGNQNPLRYDKVHLVPFGEYIPWINSVPALKDFFFKYISPYDFDYTLSPGDSFTVFEFYYKPEVDKKAKAMLRVASPICYEDVDAAVCRRMVYSSKGRKRVDMLVNLTNSAWYSGLDQRPQHLQIAAMRSIENRVPMARSVNTGISAILDSLGTVRFEVRSNDQNQFLEGFISDRVMSDPRNTLYGRLGCLPMMALSLLFLLLVLMAILTRRQVTENHS